MRLSSIVLIVVLVSAILLAGCSSKESNPPVEEPEYLSAEPLSCFADVGEPIKVEGPTHYYPSPDDEGNIKGDVVCTVTYYVLPDSSQVAKIDLVVVEKRWRPFVLVDCRVIEGEVVRGYWFCSTGDYFVPPEHNIHLGLAHDHNHNGRVTPYELKGLGVSICDTRQNESAEPLSPSLGTALMIYPG